MVEDAQVDQSGKAASGLTLMTSTAPVATVKFSKLLETFEFLSFDSQFEHSAYIDAETGAILWVSPKLELEDDDVPDDVETSDRYIAIPHKEELNLGRNLVLDFADQELPGHFDTVVGFFRTKGAYGRFKNFLEARKLLERWYAFEARAIERALRAWCEENRVALVEEPSATLHSATPRPPS